MPLRLNRFLIAVLASWSGATMAVPTAAPVRAEIDSLLGKLQASGCQFNRNGAWYSGASQVEGRQWLSQELLSIRRAANKVKP